MIDTQEDVHVVVVVRVESMSIDLLRASLSEREGTRSTRAKLMSTMRPTILAAFHS